MSFFKKLFGGGEPKPKAPPKPIATASHAGFDIVATPSPEGGQFRLYGTISKEIEGEVKTHTLIRADLFSSADEAASAMIQKAKRVIDEQGDRLFD